MEERSAGFCSTDQSSSCPGRRWRPRDACRGPQLASAAPLRPALVRPGQARVMPIADSQSGTTDLPVDQMLQILPGEWEVNKEGILEIDFGRTDLEPVIGE